MLLPLIQCIVAYAFTRACWRMLRQLVVKADLDNVPGPASHSFLKGVRNFSKLFNINAWDFHKGLSQQYGGVVRIKAILGAKLLYVSDPKALHHIVVQDQNVFQHTSSFITSQQILFGKSLLATIGDEHRKQRKRLNPVFSIAHMRQMIPIFYEVTYKMGNTLGSKVAAGTQEIDVMHWITRTALELIAQSGLGYSIDSLTDDLDTHPYSTAVKQLVPVMFKMIFFRSFLSTTLLKLGPPRFRRFLVDLLPFENVRRLRDIVNVMDNTSIEIFEAKRRALKEGDEAIAKQTGRGKDIISVLMKANLEASKGDKLSDSEVLAQVARISDIHLSLIFAAMDTTSNALSRTLGLLATHPEIQDKLRQEILDAHEKNGGQDFSYDELVSLPFLDAVCRETLRLYPPISLVLRTPRKDAVLPLFTPITGVDGRQMNEILVPKDTKIIISIINYNRDPALWGPDSYEWNPERWLAPLPDTIMEAPVPGIYSHMMTFLGGGRACIGFKFSQLEMKVVLSVLLSKFRFALSDKEIVWEMSTISAPTIKGHPQVPAMPLRVVPL
ncbi:cytochrome P450 [Tricholoma matsutake]|nr:cytochrome P450 [Tricholoma matsutake 945]